MKKRVLSGIQPTGNFHIGNYLGAIRNWVVSQAEYDNIFCIVDLHAITVRQDPKELRKNIREAAGLLFASGIDPKKSALFVQSDVPEHTELTWILNCMTPMGWMNRMTQFKEKSEKQKESASVGLFDYPILMASDILLYESDLIPVGEDQMQHVELARDIAGRFNNLYGETFKLPKATMPKVGARIMGLDDPTKKMSKSEDKQGHAVGLLDKPEEILKKIKRAQTDSGREIKFDEKRPGVFNLLSIYQAFTGEERGKIETHFDGKGYGDLKKEVGEVVVEGLKPIQAEYEKLTRDPKQIDLLLKEGSARVRSTAQKVLKMVKDKVGLGI